MKFLCLKCKIEKGVQLGRKEGRSAFLKNRNLIMTHFCLILGRDFYMENYRTIQATTVCRICFAFCNVFL